MEKLSDEEVIRVAMSLLGKRKSKRKAQASRRNGQLGGRKKKPKNNPK